MISRLSIIAILWAALAVHSPGTPSRDTDHAVVHGAVTGPASADISGAKVYFVHGKKTIQIRTSPDGSYSAKLDPGIYSMRVEYPGFCNGLRGEFSARAGSHINFDFRLTQAAAPVVATVEIGPYGYATSPSRSLGGCYKSEDLAAPVPDGPKPLVLYEKREVSGDVVRYSGLRYNSAIYMYDKMTVRATTLEYSAKDYSIQGSAGVTLQDGETVTNATQIRITFRDGKPQIDPSE